MPDMLGIDDFFIPEEVERIWSVEKGQRLPLSGPSVKNNRIGKGGFGETFSVDGWLGEGLPSFPCDDARYGSAPLETRCCLKVIGKTQLTESEEAYLDRTMVEYQVLSDAQGANGRVPRPLGWGRVSVGGNPYWGIVMEYLPNGNGTYFLSDADMKNDRVQCLPGVASPLQVATFAYQLCLALRDLHSCRGEVGITHRDLQPNNVAVRLAMARGIVSLPSRAGIVDRVYMIDLGNSTTMERLATPAFGDRAPRAATYQYGAPEVFDMYDDGHEGSLWHYRNKPTADIWSLGALIYHYMTNQHPTLFDMSKRAYRDIATLPKRGGLCIPQSRLDEYPGDRVALLLDDIVRRCTVFDPERRREGADLLEIIAQLEGVLFKPPVSTPPIPPEDTPPLTPDEPPVRTLYGPPPMGDDTPTELPHGTSTDPIDDLTGAPTQPMPEPRTMPASCGPLAFELLDSYQLLESADARQSYCRTDADGRSYRLISSWERCVGSGHNVTKAAYANLLAQRIDKLFLHTGTVKGDDALAQLAVSGAVVKPDRGTHPAYCTISFTVPQSEGQSYVMRLHLYFEGDCAVMLGLGCRCRQEDDYATKELVEHEMEQIALSLDRSA